jgi:antitoxin (DNA-binding transcriptional repressor) of toxin-antitoxin stability system
MTATLEQVETELARLIALAQRGEEIVITSQGRAIARLSGIPSVTRPRDRKAWLAKLAGLRERLTTGKAGPTVEQILDEDRGE